MIIVIAILAGTVIIQMVTIFLLCREVIKIKEQLGLMIPVLWTNLSEKEFQEERKRIREIIYLFILSLLNFIRKHIWGKKKAYGISK